MYLSFNVSLLQHVCKTFTLHLGVPKKINNLSFLAINALIGFLNFTFYAAHKKKQSLQSFLQKTCSLKYPLMTVQHKNSATRRDGI